VSSTRPIKAAKLNQRIPQEYENAFGHSSKSAQPLSKPSGRKPYVQTKLCPLCGIPHHWRQKCPPAPPAAMQEKPEQCRTAEPGKDYPDHNPDRVIDWGMPGAWADRSPQRRVRQKKVASLPSSQTPTQKSWTASSESDGLRGLREVVEASSEVVEPNYVHKHHKVPRTSIDLGIQCRIPPEYIVSTEDGGFTEISFVPKGETRIAVPRDIN
jgi:hypothetical protein